jgi:16S rRNA (guanine966-N2)-methyltransferase
MRIISGNLKGRVFAEPHGHHTHPMSEKVRGALFNALGDINGLTVLDAFAGSGALSFEAVSRGAVSAVAVERDQAVHKVVKQSAQELRLDKQIKTVRASASGWSDHNMEKQFDIVLLAPPYDELQINILQKLTKHLKANGILVLDYPGKEQPPEFKWVKTVHSKNYGDAQLVFYRKIK